MKRPGPGRPSKLTPEVTEKVLVALRAGNWRQVAAEYAGISSRTFRDWMAAGATEPKSPEGEFRRQVVEAEKSAEMRMVALVMKAAVGDAKHAEWWLERKANRRWGRKDRLETSESKETKEIRAMTDEQLRAALQDEWRRRMGEVATEAVKQ